MTRWLKAAVQFFDCSSVCLNLLLTSFNTSFALKLVLIIVPHVDLQKDKELEKLQNLLKARCSQVEKLQRNLSEQTETLESFKYQVSSLTDELATLNAKHEQCQQRDDGSRDLEEQIVQLKHSLLREQSNNEAMMHAFQEQERQWEEEKTKILSSLKNGPENTESLIAEENVSLKRRLDDLQRDLNTKEQEHAEILQQKERRASSAANVKLDLETKIRALESQCEELKYKLVQKDEEIFEKDECLKKTDLEVSRLKAKYVAAEEVERELRHHLGEVTQQLEWSKENNSETVQEGHRDEETDQQKLKEALNAANREVRRLPYSSFSIPAKKALYIKNVWCFFISTVEFHNLRVLPLLFSSLLESQVLRKTEFKVSEVPPNGQVNKIVQKRTLVLIFSRETWLGISKLSELLANMNFHWLLLRNQIHPQWDLSCLLNTKSNAFLYIHIPVLSQLSVLRAEKQEQDLERLENERREIVEAAKQFALQQEERFSNKIENLEHKLSAKNDELQEMESVVQQLRHGLKTVQQEKVSETILQLRARLVKVWIMQTAGYNTLRGQYLRVVKANHPI